MVILTRLYFSICISLFCGQICFAQADLDKSQIVRFKASGATGEKFRELPLWFTKIGMGPQFQEVVTVPNQSAELIAVLKDGREIPIANNYLGFFMAGAAASEDIELFASGSLLFNNFKFLKNPNSQIKEAPSGITRIIVIGATWCGFCKPRTGAILKYFGNRNRKSISPYEVIYLEYTGTGNEVEQTAPIQQFLQSKSLTSGFYYPSVVIQRGKEFLTQNEANEFLNAEISKLSPSTNLLTDLKGAKDFLSVSRVLMTSVFTDIGQFETDIIRKYQLAGLLVYRRQAENKSSSDLKKIFEQMQNANQDLLFIAVDQEGGNVQRIMTTDTCKLPPAEHLAGKSEDQIKRFSEIMARDLLRSGINMNFNPVLDLKDSRSKDITGWQRAISENPQEVSRVAAIVNSVLVENGILTVGKHFPGIGATNNTHSEPAIVQGNFQSLKNRELVPFINLINSTSSLSGVMLGNVTLPAYDDSKPITFSKEAINRLIRGEVGYQGLLINDGFHMESSTAYFTEESAPYYALLAGVAPIYVNSNFLSASIRFILQKLADPTVPQSEKDAVRAALVSAQTRIKKVKSVLKSMKPKIDLTSGCTKEDNQFLDQLVGNSNWRVNSL